MRALFVIAACGTYWLYLPAMTSFRSAGRRRYIDGPVRRVNPVLEPAGQPEQARLAQDGSVMPVAVRQVNPEPVVIPVQTARHFKYEKAPVAVPAGKLLRVARRVGIALVVLALVVGGWLGYATYAAAKKIIVKAGQGAPALADSVPVSNMVQGDGRINILLLGVGGAGHDGAYLSDTMMVASVDPVNNAVAMLSVPRDLYVHIPAGKGHIASYGKINSANAIGGPTLAEQVVENVIGQPIHYYVQVDFSGFKQAVDSVGGVDVTVPTTINDPLYPCDDDVAKDKYCPIFITAGLHHMTGATALEYSRSRETTSDFDRAARQQLVLEALKQKAEQLSTLTNPVKITSLIGAIGAHVTTDMQIGDMIKLAGLLKNIGATQVSSKVLSIYGSGALLVDGSNEIPGAGSIELPAAGPFNYQGIQNFTAGYLVDPHITSENAKLEVDNGTGTGGLGGQVVAELTAAKYNVGTPFNAATHYAKTQLIDYTGGKKPYTLSYLEHRLGVKAQEAPASDGSIGASAPEIRIILGSDFSTSKLTN